MHRCTYTDDDLPIDKPCTLFPAPVFRALSLEYRSIIFLEVDTDKVPEVAISAEVDAIPAFHVYQRGNKVDSTVGAQTDKLGNMVRRYAS